MTGAVAGRSWRFVSSLDELGVIADHSVDIAVFSRELAPSFVAALEQAAQSWIEPVSLTLDAERADESVAALLERAPASIFESVAQDALDHLGRMRELVGARRFAASFGSVIGDECSKFHQDYVRLRLLVTYAGPGTVLVSRDAVNTEALAQPAADLRVANERIVRDSSGVRSASRGDVVLLKGAAWPGVVHGAVHRSPTLSTTGQRRIVLQITAVADERSLSAPPYSLVTERGHRVLLFSSIGGSSR